MGVFYEENEKSSEKKSEIERKDKSDHESKKERNGCEVKREKQEFE